jgi:hypothetical protein
MTDREEAQYKEYNVTKQGDLQASAPGNIPTANAQPGNPQGAPAQKSAEPKLKVLADHPKLSPEAQDLLDRHRLNRASDQAVEANPEVVAYYKYMASIDPTHPAIAQPGYHLVPTPRGGLDAIVVHMLGALDQKNDSASYRAEYQKEYKQLRYILYRLNSDILRSDSRYRLGELIRVPNEYV